MAKNRYAVLTVDTEALPKRASQNHVQRLMWGSFANGRAGVREMAEIGNEFAVKHVFFTDLCATWNSQEEALEVVRWLAADGQDVQLHTHPEYLPDGFWVSHQLPLRPVYMNQYTDDARASVVIDYFSDLLSKQTGKRILAHRAGSFRWNACTIRALQAALIPLSFNNSMSALHAGQSVYAEATNQPFVWSNGVIEIPMTEKKILPKVGKDEWWARLTYPESSYFRFRPWWGSVSFNLFSGSPDLSIFLLHSWSLLHWDENGYACYRDDARTEGYRKLLARLTKDYDVITTPELLDLYQKGEINATHTVDISAAEFGPGKKKAK